MMGKLKSQGRKSNIHREVYSPSFVPFIASCYRETTMDGSSVDYEATHPGCLGVLCANGGWEGWAHIEKQRRGVWGIGGVNVNAEGGRDP